MGLPYMCNIYSDRRKNLELETIILHEDYDSFNQAHDIALLKLKEPLDLSVRRKKIYLMNPMFKDAQTEHTFL